MPIRTEHATRYQRRDLLVKIEAFSSEFLADLERRKADGTTFWYYIDFCSPMVMDVIAWERIHAIDLREMPSTKKLFIDLTKAAHSAFYEFGHRDPEFDRGRAKRSFNEISQGELAANILPRLMQLLHHWGITLDSSEGAVERQLSESEIKQLTRYYGKV